MKRVVFLDYDGVVNNIVWDYHGERARYGMPNDNKVNDFQAVMWVSEFCKKYGYDIVVTSTWRKHDNYKQCLINGGLKDGIKILGRVSLKGSDRDEHILEYLKLNPDIKEWLIFDDESPKSRALIERTVLCDHDGFKYIEYHKACDLHKSLYEKDI